MIVDKTIDYAEHQEAEVEPWIMLINPMEVDPPKEPIPDPWWKENKKRKAAWIMLINLFRPENDPKFRPS